MSQRSSGVLLHPTSLYTPYMIGDIGPAARSFVEWLARAGVSAWQLLPLSPPDAGGSPYSSRSAFACDPLLISLDDLVTSGLLEAQELSALEETSQDLATGRSERSSALAHHSPLIELAVERWLARHGPDSPLLRDFRAASRAWIEDAALFELISALEGGAPWWEWPHSLRDRDSGALHQLKQDHADTLTRYCVTQLLVDQQWRALQAHCASCGVKLIGDMPIYVDHNSADVWSRPRLFDLIEEDDERRGQVRVVAGVPPDAFSDVGQRWGNPIYRWDRMREDGYQWWCERISRAISLTDLVRIDHFRALCAYWEIPQSSPDARSGQWLTGPGLHFFKQLEAQLGAPLPLIAEDLGLIDEPVRELLRETGLPGMKVLQFAFGSGADNLYLPHNHTERCVVYTGTHDNETTRGWWEGLDEHSREHVRAYLRQVDQEGAVWGLVRAAFASVAALSIVPLQDLLNLDNQARMNRPGVSEGNWSWRLGPEALSEALSESVRQLNQLYGRAR